jgi:hypothetical protein
MSQYYGQVEIKYQEDEARYMRRRISETRAEFFSAKARMAVFGNREVNIFLAGVERRGGFTGNDVIARQLTTQAIQSLREQFGFKRKDVPYRDLATVLFGPTQEERDGSPADGLRGWSAHIEQ